MNFPSRYAPTPNQTRCMIGIGCAHKSNCSPDWSDIGSMNANWDMLKMYLTHNK